MNIHTVVNVRLVNPPVLLEIMTNEKELNRLHNHQKSHLLIAIRAHLEWSEPVSDETIPLFVSGQIGEARGCDNAGDVAGSHDDNAHCGGVRMMSRKQSSTIAHYS